MSGIPLHIFINLDQIPARGTSFGTSSDYCGLEFVLLEFLMRKLAFQAAITAGMREINVADLLENVKQHTPSQG